MNKTLQKFRNSKKNKKLKTNIKIDLKYISSTRRNKVIFILTKNKINSIIRILFFIILIFHIDLISTKSSKKRNLNSDSEINLTIKGTGNQRILNEKFNQMPNQIYINGQLQNYSSYQVMNLEKEENNITLKWNYQLENCKEMFCHLSNIIKIDFSNFDSSCVNNMKKIFEGCTSLVSINFNNINTKSVTNMDGMFMDCKSLISLDLSHFNTSSVIFMYSMFSGCSSLEYINLTNFNTSLVPNMDKMFFNCGNLTSLDLSYFNTSSVVSMCYMFYGCSSLKELNLSNFNTLKVTNMNHMFSL